MARGTVLYAPQPRWTRDLSCSPRWTLVASCTWLFFSIFAVLPVGRESEKTKRKKQLTNERESLTLPHNLERSVRRSRHQGSFVREDTGGSPSPIWRLATARSASVGSLWALCCPLYRRQPSDTAWLRVGCGRRDDLEARWSPWSRGIQRHRGLPPTRYSRPVCGKSDPRDTVDMFRWRRLASYRWNVRIQVYVSRNLCIAHSIKMGKIRPKAFLGA